MRKDLAVMKVLHIPRRFVKEDWGGTETVILKTLQQLRKTAVCGEIFTTLALSNTPYEEIESVPVRRFPYFYPFWGLSEENKRDMDKKGGNLFSWDLARALYREADVDLLHAHTGKRLGGIVRTIARMRGIPYVVSLHGGHLQIPDAERKTLAAPRKKAVEWGKVLGALVGSRSVMRDADAIICVGRGEMEKMQRAWPEKLVYYLPNGVDTGWFENGDKKSFREKYGYTSHDRIIITVGRIDPQKNQKLLIESLPEILKYEPHAKLLFVGPVTLQDYCTELEELIAKMKLSDKVRIIKGFPPGSRDLVDAYHASDLFVLPSRHEPFGIVLLEAWSSGLPVVASNVGGIPGLVDQLKTGILCESQNSSEFVSAIVSCLKDHNFSAALAGRGKKEAKARYEWTSVCRQLQSIYQEVIRRHRERQSVTLSKSVIDAFRQVVG
jgi:glycosyltransferase involved in cell wall biosynthesis